MANLKLKIKKAKMVRKIDGQKVTGYYGRVLSNGSKSFDEIAKFSCKGSTIDPREAELAAKMLIDGIAENLRNGFIVDLGVLGKLYPAVNGRWDTDAENLSLSDMKPKVNYKPGADIDAAIRGAQLQWTTEAETDENTVDDPENQGGDNGGGGNGGGGNPPGELEG